MGNINKKVNYSYSKSPELIDQIQLSNYIDYFKLYLQENNCNYDKWTEITNKFINSSKSNSKRQNKQYYISNKNRSNLENENFDDEDEMDEGILSDGMLDEHIRALEGEEMQNDPMDDNYDLLNVQEQQVDVGYQEYNDEVGPTFDETMVGDTSLPVYELSRQNLIYDAKIAAEYPLGMHVIGEWFHYHFYVPDCIQSRADFIEVNHIPVADLQTNEELTTYLRDRGFLNSAMEPQEFRKPAKDTNNFRKVISLKCKFDIDLRISDSFWSHKGIKVRAYGLVGPTWTSVFSAYCYFENSSCVKSLITTDLKSNLFIDKVLSANRFYCPTYRNIDNYCMGPEDGDEVENTDDEGEYEFLEQNMNEVEQNEGGGPFNSDPDGSLGDYNEL